MEIKAMPSYFECSFCGSQYADINDAQKGCLMGVPETSWKIGDDVILISDGPLRKLYPVEWKRALVIDVLSPIEHNGKIDKPVMTHGNGVFGKVLWRMPHEWRLKVRAYGSTDRFGINIVPYTRVLPARPRNMTYDPSLAGPGYWFCHRGCKQRSEHVDPSDFHAPDCLKAGSADMMFVYGPATVRAIRDPATAAWHGLDLHALFKMLPWTYGLTDT